MSRNDNEQNHQESFDNQEEQITAQTDLANKLVLLAIQDINSLVIKAIKNNTNFIANNGHKKALLLQKIEMIRNSEAIKEAIVTLGWVGPNALDQAVQTAIDQINQIAEKQEQELLQAKQVINAAIEEINSITEAATLLNLIGEDGQRKAVQQQIHNITKNDKVQKALDLLEWETPNPLSETVRLSIAQITKLAEMQQAAADEQKRKMDEAKEYIEQTIITINFIALFASKLDLTSQSHQKKIILDQIRSIVKNDTLRNALDILGWKSPNDLSNAVQVAVKQIRHVAAKQEELLRFKNALKESKEADTGPEADKVEPINLDKISVDEALEKLRELDQGYGMILGDRIRLTRNEQIKLKAIIDDAINPERPPSAPQKFDVNPNNIQNLKIHPGSSKLKNILVNIEQIDGRILVKVGPSDISGVGGHLVREQIIRDVVNQALKKSRINKEYEDVNVSAVIAVRGRLQMLQGLFMNTREEPARHSNAYIKTDKEKTLTHWEPRKGPQSIFNDTICAMVTCVSTSLFEKGIRENNINSSAEATEKILRSSALREAFDHLLSTAKDRIINLIQDIRTKFNISAPPEKDIALHYKTKIQEDNDIDSIEEDKDQLRLS